MAVVLLWAGVGGCGELVEYVHLDAIGNVRAVTNQAQQVVERHDYLPFGEECTSGACAANPGVNGGQPRKFTGKERDAETGLDYFGARYYGSRIGRFTTTDPAYTIQENLVDPQRWNRYAYARNNPLRYVDPDGREVRYANAQLQKFFAFLSARSGMVRDTLGLYTGPGRPDLLITHGDAGRDIDGAKNAGSFTAEADVAYDDAATKQMRSDMTLEQIEDLGTWSLVGESVLTLDSSLTVSVQDRRTIGVAVHELGHADHAARSPLDYRRKSEQVRDAKGKIIEHDKRPAEKIANEYRDKAVREVQP
jgi:RHS repeat-associated protein